MPVNIKQIEIDSTHPLIIGIKNPHPDLSITVRGEGFDFLLLESYGLNWLTICDPGLFFFVSEALIELQRTIGILSIHT